MQLRQALPILLLLPFLISTDAAAQSPKANMPAIPQPPSIGLVPGAASCAAMQSTKPGEIGHYKFKRIPPVSALHCYDGIYRGDKPTHNPEIVDYAGKTSTADGDLYWGPYVPHKGAVNSYFYHHDPADLKGAMRGDPVEQIGEVVKFGEYKGNKNQAPIPILHEIEGLAGKEFVAGKISQFGGPDDHVPVKGEKVAGENTAMTDIDTNEEYCTLRVDLKTALDLAHQAELAKNPKLRKSQLSTNPYPVLNKVHFLIVNPRNGRSTACKFKDWGPAQKTGKLIDASPAVLKKLATPGEGIDSVDGKEMLVALAKEDCLEGEGIKAPPVERPL